MNGFTKAPLSRRQTAAVVATVVALALAGCANDSVDPLVPPPSVDFPRIDWSPKFSSDPMVIMYVHAGIDKIASDGAYSVNWDSVGIWIHDLTGKPGRIILNRPLQSIDWSLTGEWLAFGSGAQVFQARMEGDSIVPASIQQLTTSGRNFFPAWSPDEEWIAFDNTSCESQKPNSCGIFKMKRDGNSLQFVVQGRMPAWSPDGKYLIYVGLGGGIYRISVLNPGNPELLVLLNGDNRHPTYSPDRNHIAFVTVPPESKEEIFLMRSDGSGLRRLVAGSWPTWSPDGVLIVFQRAAASSLSENGTLWIVGIDGEGLRQLTYGPR